MEHDTTLHQLFAHQKSQGLEELLSRFKHDPAKAFRVLRKFEDVITLTNANINHFLTNAYFRRIWVYQEALLAPNTEHGHRKVTIKISRSSIRWGDLVDIVRFVVRPQKSPGPYQENIAWFEKSWCHMGRYSRAPYEQYYCRTQGFTSSNPRDRFYALLRLGYNTRAAVRVNPSSGPTTKLPSKSSSSNSVELG